MEKVSKATSFSTILIGIYMVLLSCVEIAAALFCKIAGDAAMTGVDITAMARGSDDYISGYFIVPRILGTVFSGMAEITVLILAAVLFIVLLIFLAVLIISCILIKKRKLKADENNRIFNLYLCGCISHSEFSNCSDDGSTCSVWGIRTCKIVK